MLCEFGLYHCNKLVDSEEAARQSICKNLGCRRQQAAGGNGSLMIFIFCSPLSADYLLLWLWPNADAPSIHKALAWAMCQPKCEQELSEQFQEAPWPPVDHGFWHPEYLMRCYASLVHNGCHHMLAITLHQVSRAEGTMRGKKITLNSKLSGDTVGSLGDPRDPAGSAGHCAE